MAKRELTPREQEVLDLQAAGETHAGIADKLGMSVRTVASHVRGAHHTQQGDELPDES